MMASVQAPTMRPDEEYVTRLLAHVPVEMRQGASWVCWKWEAPAPRKMGKRSIGTGASTGTGTGAKRAPARPIQLTKVPYNPHNGRKAKANDARTWGTFDEALACYRRGGYAGLGYELSAGAEIIAIDLDKCRDVASEEIAPWALAIIERMASYTEISPSGTGVHIWLCATLPAKEHSKAGHIEIYAADRFMTVTGERLPDTPAGIEERGRQLAAFYGETFAPKQQKRAPLASPAPRPDLALSDADILARAKNDAKFQALWHGDASGYPSASEADMALIGRLRFYAQGDAGAIDRLFRQSGLMRPEKWDTRHFASGETYGERTIAYALANGPYPVYVVRLRQKWQKRRPARAETGGAL